MKDLKDMERLGLEELMEIVDDKSVKAPENLAGFLGKAIDAEALIEEVSKDEEPAALKSRPVALMFRRIAPYVAAAAVVVMAFVAYPSHPKDTFDDPALAYAELEKTFAYMSSKTGKALDMARLEGDQAMEKTINMLDF